MAGREFYVWAVRSCTVHVALDTVDRINSELARRSRDEEQGGILLGRVNASGIVQVTGFEFIRSEHRRGIAYDLGLKERQRLGRYVQNLRRKRGEQPVGFFRTHERPGLFLDQDDFSTMTQAFAEPSSIALLIGHSDAGFFFWEDGDMDRRAPLLSFPFDSQALRALGPIRTEEPASSVRGQRRVPAWQAFAIAAAAAVAAFAGVSAATSTRPQPAVSVVKPAPAARESKVSVAVSMEPRTKIPSHVPPADAKGFLPPRPNGSLSPRVPDQMAAHLNHPMPVDVKVDIDENGVVRNTEVLSGGGTGFSSLAADKAFWTAWQPARQGDQRVASEMIVHYRFTPTTEERP